MAASALEPQSTELQQLLGSKDKLTPILITFIIGLLTSLLVIVIWMRRKVTLMRSSEAMPTSDAPPKITSRPKDLRPLNDSVWELYKPPDGVQQIMDIIFFHGSQMRHDEEAFWKTWLSLDETVVWPKAWLAKEFKEARILSISYDSAIQKFSEQMDMYLVIENLIHDIIWSSNCKAGQKCPVIFAGHCFGGMIIKMFLLKCDEEANSRNQSALTGEEKRKWEELKSFLQNCKAILYYSPPAGGARLNGGALQNLIFGDMNKGLVDFLKVLSPKTSRINEKFVHLQDKFQPKLITKTIGAGKKSKIKLWDFEVPEASARQYADDIYWAADADHFAVSRAKDSSTHVTFTRLRGLVADHYIVSSSISIDKDENGEDFAQKLGITFAQLKAANPGVDWHDLYVGQVIKIPGSRSPSSILTYTVVLGDTGGEIAKKLGITPAQLDATNPDVEWHALSRGQGLKVRGINFVQLEAADPVDWDNLYIGQVLKVRDSGTWSSSSTTYKVISGDTAPKIAQKFGMTFHQLEALNCKLTLEVPTSSGSGGDVGGGDGGGNKKNKITPKKPELQQS